SIFDDDRLVERLAHDLGELPRHGIGGASRRKRYDQRDLLGRIILRQRGHRHDREEQRNSRSESDHEVLQCSARRRFFRDAFASYSRAAKRAAAELESTVSSGYSPAGDRGRGKSPPPA